MNPNIIRKISEYKFDFEKIKNDTLAILNEFNLPQIGLTHSIKTLNASMEDKILECTGSIFDYDLDEFKFEERDFTLFNDIFKSTALYEMYQTIPNIGRFRIMTMDGPKCYTIHGDLSMRYHYVIETNPDCIFLFPQNESFYHIPCDQNLYLVDTRKKHTFINGSRSRRIHLVMDDLSTLLPIRKP